MKRAVVLVAVLLLVVSCKTSKRVSYLVVPPAVKVNATDIDAYLEKYSEHDAVFLEVEETYEHSGSQDGSAGTVLFGSLGSDWRYIRMSRLKYMVLNPDAAHLTYTELSYKPDQFYSRVISPSGEVRMYGVKDLVKEETGSGEKVFRIVYPDVQPGTTIEEGWEEVHQVIAYPPPLKYDQELQYPYPCEHLKLTFACPEWWVVQLKEVAAGQLPPVVRRTTPESKKQWIEYEARDIPALKKEAFAPFYRQMANYAVFMVTDMQMSVGSLERPRSWYDYHEDLHSRYAAKKDKALKEVFRVCDSLTSGIESDVEKLRVIDRFAKERIAYDWKGFKGNFSKVLLNRKGSYLDRAALVYHMARHLGFRSSLLLMHSAINGHFDRRYVDPGQLTTAAAQVDIDKQTFLSIPRLKEAPLEHIPGAYLNQQCMDISSEMQIFRLSPREDADVHETELEIDLTILADGAVQVKSVKRLHGLFSYSTRKKIASMSETGGLEKLVRDMFRYQVGEISDFDYKCKDVRKYDRPLSIETSCVLSNVCMVARDDVVFQTAGLLSPEAILRVKLDPGERQSPVVIDREVQYTSKVRIHFPQEWQLATNLQPSEIDNDFGQLRATYVVEPGLITFDRSLVLNRTRQPRESYPELRKLIGGGPNLDVPTLVFATSSSEASP